jgi:hypothetical protein
MYRFFPLSIVLTIFYYYNETSEQNKFRLATVCIYNPSIINYFTPVPYMKSYSFHHLLPFAQSNRRVDSSYRFTYLTRTLC